MQNGNNGYTPASTAQINYLKRLGYTGVTEGLTNAEASALIQQYNARGNSQPQSASSYSNPYEAQQPTYQPQTKPNPNVPSVNQMALILKNDELANGLFENLNELAGSGQLYFPEHYSIGNALKSAMFAIVNSEQSDKLLACTDESKKQALTEYVIQGLDASKKQCYFIPYGNKCQLMRSYFGDVLVTKATGLVTDVYAEVIYDGDDIEIGFDDYGRETLIKHTTKFLNRDNPIIGAYAVAVGVNGYKLYNFMTWKEIQKSWDMSKSRNGKFLTNFQQEGCKRTAIRRLVKMLFNTSLNTTEQQDALIGSYNRTTEDEYINSTSSNAEVRDSNVNAVHQHQAEEQATIQVDPSKLPKKEATPASTPKPQETATPAADEDTSWMN